MRDFLWALQGRGSLQRMKISLAKDALEQVAADVLALFVAGAKPEKDSTVQRLDDVLGGTLLRAVETEGFKGDKGSTLALVTPAGIPFGRVLLVGMGAGDATPARCREFGVLAARASADRASIAALAPNEEAPALEALTHGLVTGGYRFTRYLTGDRKPKRLLGKGSVLVSERATKVQRGAITAGQVLGDAINLARDLVNMPPNDLSATVLAQACQSACKGLEIQCKVFDKRGIERLGMPLLLAVNRGSKEEPRFVHMTYKPAGRKRLKRVAFVGKGLTFDSGGLCLKPAASMIDMKTDMAGAATTLGVVVAAAKLKLPVEVHAIIGSTDNMTGGDAYRPGDVFPSRKGVSVEIINTDAEGRLVLADALAYAAEQEPDYIVDHATLTGACMVALGQYRAALFANDDGLRESYAAAAEVVGEEFWPLPLDDGLREELQSSIADLKHTGGRLGGTITAALFLREFIGDKAKWAHLDIAGPSFLPSNHGTLSKGGTGFGVLTAVEFLRTL